MDSAAIAKPRARLWTKNFTLLATANLLLGIAFYFLIPILPMFLADTQHLSMGVIGILMALFTITALIIRPFTGFWLDRYNRRTLYLAAFALMASLFALYPLASGVMAVALVRLAHGGAWGMTTTASSAIVADIVPAARRGEGISFFGLSMTVAMSLGPLLGVSIVKYLNYRSMFYTGFGLAFAGFALAWAVSYPKSNSRKPFAWNGLIERICIPVALVQLVLNIAYGGLISYVVMLGKQIGVSNPGNFFLFFAVGMGLSRVWSGKVFDRRGPAVLLRAGFGLLAAGYLILFFSKTPVIFLLAAVTTGIGSGITMPSFQTMVNMLVSGERRGAANSTFFVGFDIGIGVGMIAIGYLANHLGLRVSFLVCAGIVAGAFALFEGIALRTYMARTRNPSGPGAGSV